LNKSVNQREAIRMLADRVGEAGSTEELLELLEQIVTNCSEIIGEILADEGSEKSQKSPIQEFSNNEIS
jgi:hypothetical protein